MIQRASSVRENREANTVLYYLESERERAIHLVNTCVRHREKDGPPRRIGYTITEPCIKRPTIRMRRGSRFGPRLQVSRREMGEVRTPFPTTTGMGMSRNDCAV